MLESVIENGDTLVNGAVYLYFVDAKLTKGSFDDLRKLGITPEEGMRLTFYDFDADEKDHPTYLCAEGILHFDKNTSTWHVHVEKDSFRSVLQSGVGE
jgi:hypothetical protein